MAERRSTSVVLQIEYRAIRSHRVSAVVTQIEYRPIRIRKVSNLVTQLEFHFPLLPEDKRFGPSVQVI